ncbi:MAG: hypothetical protein HYS13_19095 [Planctomycetia bacterium]|nr:hypothetical protein [Planctomycetia bacterium]
MRCGTTLGAGTGVVVLVGCCVAVLILGCGGAEEQKRQNDALNQLPHDKVTSDWQVHVDGKTVQGQFFAAVGAEVKVSGTFKALEKDFQPGYLFVQVTQTGANGKRVIHQTGETKLPTAAGNGTYSFDSTVKMPTKPGAFALEVSFQGIPWTRAIEVR